MTWATTSALLTWPPVGHGVARFRARAFAGEAVDLDIDFAGSSRMSLVTALLACCVRDENEDALPMLALQQWSVAERLQGLLAIASASVGPLSHAIATCTLAGCGGQIELALGNEGFARAAVVYINWSSPEDSAVRLPVPTGDDLAAWESQVTAAGFEDAWWVRRLIVDIGGQCPTSDWIPPAAWLAPIADALDEADPLTNLVLNVDCPFCGAGTLIDVDLEFLLIERLGACQRRLTEDVHRLASLYHWRERDIADLPMWRRRQYLARIQAEFA